MSTRDLPSQRRPRVPRGAVSGAIKLILACLLVGLVLTVLRIDPVRLWQGLWSWITNGIAGAFDFGTEGIAVVAALVLTGAVVVVPIWLVRALLRRLR